MSVLNKGAQDKIKEHLQNMKEPVEIFYFTQEFECEACRDTHQLVQEISALTDKLNLKIYDFVKDQQQVEKLGIEQIPAISLQDKYGEDKGIRFYGAPGGYEINSFLKVLLELSGVREELPGEIRAQIEDIHQEVVLKVFVTLSCPYCPTAVMNAHRLALENDHIKAEMIESTSFPHLANRYKVSSVPRTIINEKEVLVGAHPLAEILKTIKKL